MTAFQYTFMYVCMYGKIPLNQANYQRVSVDINAVAMLWLFLGFALYLSFVIVFFCWQNIKKKKKKQTDIRTKKTQI